MPTRTAPPPTVRAAEPQRSRAGGLEQRDRPRDERPLGIRAARDREGWARARRPCQARADAVARAGVLREQAFESAASQVGSPRASRVLAEQVVARGAGERPTVAQRDGGSESVAMPRVVGGGRG